MANAADLLWDSASVQARFEGTGAVSPEACLALGLVGPAARACGVECDVRHDFPSGIFRFAQIPVSTWTTGDVFARAYVRWLEIQRSVAFIREPAASASRTGRSAATSGLCKPDQLVVSLVEGWRGEICHVALTDGQGRFARYKIVDPSFHNWTGWRWPCATSRSPISRCATRASTCRTADTTCRETTCCELFARTSGTRPPDDRLSGAACRALPDRFRGLPVLDASKCPDGCRACAEACPTDAITFDGKGLRLDLGRCLFCTDCTRPVPKARSATPRTTAWPRDAARTWCCDGRDA